VAPRSVADELGLTRIDPAELRTRGDHGLADYVERATSQRRAEQIEPSARRPSGDPLLDTRLPATQPRASAEPTTSPDTPSIRLEIVCTNFGTEVPRREPGAEQIPDSKARVLEGHEIHFLLAGERIDEPDALRQRLLALAGDPRARVPDPARPGETMLKAVLIAPGEGATYGDVAVTVDAVTSAGFSEIIFGRRRGSR
jgi:hypothetical protein